MALTRTALRAHPGGVWRDRASPLIPRRACQSGDSSMPSVDGTTGEEAHCVAFESTATNLGLNRCPILAGGALDRNGPVSHVLMRTLKPTQQPGPAHVLGGSRSRVDPDRSFGRPVRFSRISSATP
jgi:hypothetical protein